MKSRPFALRVDVIFTRSFSTTKLRPAWSSVKASRCRAAIGCPGFTVTGLTELSPSASRLAWSITRGSLVSSFKFSMAVSSGVWLNSIEIGLSSFISMSNSPGERVRK